MKHAIYAPNFNDYGDPNCLVELAVAAEASGYDGFFIWDHLVFEPSGRLPLADATVALAAIAGATRRLSIGAMVTPVARRRPWKLARELVTLDHLSGGRLIFGVGLGEPAELEFALFGEATEAPIRAAKLDEGLEIIDALARGQTVNHHGEHYSVNGARFSPPAAQQPRFPIWTAASLPARAGLRRAARWDGVLPVQIPAEQAVGDGHEIDWSEWWLDSEAFAAMVEYVDGRRPAGQAFDYVASGRLGGGESQSEFAAAGASWWCEWVYEQAGSHRRNLELVQRGPGT